MRCLGILSSGRMQSLFEENYKSLFRGTKEYLVHAIRWNIVKMLFLLKLIFKLKAISFKSEKNLFVN